MQAGDVIGWVSNRSSGSLAFERTTNDPSFFYPRTKFSITIQAFLTASANVRRHEIKHILRAHVSQPSLAAVNINFIGAGIHTVTAVITNTAESELKTCEVSVQVWHWSHHIVSKTHFVYLGLIIWAGRLTWFSAPGLVCRDYFSPVFPKTKFGITWATHG